MLLQFALISEERQRLSSHKAWNWTHLWPDWLFLLPRTQMSLRLDENLCAKEGGKEKTGEASLRSLLSPSHGPLRFVNSHSRFRAEEEVVIFIFLLFSFSFTYFNFVSTVGRKGHYNTTPTKRMSSQSWQQSRARSWPECKFSGHFLPDLRYHVEKVIFTIPTKSLSVNSSSL